MAADSPLRYPGGKRLLTATISRIISSNGMTNRPYCEPFSGGAAVGLTLLNQKTVSEFHLNDLDTPLYLFWKAVLDDTGRLIQAIRDTPVDITEWRRQREIHQQADASRPFELGFAAFFMNRCNRSGIITQASPIGGYGQQGKWKVDARFNRRTLEQRVRNIAEMRDRIHLTNLDAIEIMDRIDPGETFVYLDPPYCSDGERLYQHSYRQQDHRRLAQYMLTHPGLTWVMSYDNHPITRELYAECQMQSIMLGYSLQKKRTQREVLIIPDHIRNNTGFSQNRMEM